MESKNAKDIILNNIKGIEKLIEIHKKQLDNLEKDLEKDKKKKEFIEPEEFFSIKEVD